MDRRDRDVRRRRHRLDDRLLGVRPTIGEANPIVVLALDSFGLSGLVLLKIAVYLVMLWISVTGARDGDTLLYYFPPVLLTLVGTYLTASNIRLLWLS